MKMAKYLNYWKGVLFELARKIDHDLNEDDMDDDEEKNIEVKAYFCKNQYRFTCGQTDEVTEWNIIPLENNEAVKKQTTSTGQFKTRLRKGQIYMVGCNTKTAEFIRLQMCDGSSFIAGCNTKRHGTNSNLIWEITGTSTITFPEYDNKPIISASVPKPGIWEISCKLQNTDGKIFEKEKRIVVFSHEGAGKVPGLMGLQEI